MKTRENTQQNPPQTTFHKIEPENFLQVCTFQHPDSVEVQEIQEITNKKSKALIWVWQQLIHQDLGVIKSLITCSEAPSQHTPEFCPFTEKRHKVPHFYPRYSHFWLCLGPGGAIAELTTSGGILFPGKSAAKNPSCCSKSSQLALGAPRGSIPALTQPGKFWQRLWKCLVEFPKGWPRCSV